MFGCVDLVRVPVLCFVGDHNLIVIWIVVASCVVIFFGLSLNQQQVSFVYVPCLKSEHCRPSRRTDTNASRILQLRQTIRKADNRDHARWFALCSSISRNRRSEFATFSFVLAMVAWHSATVIVVRLSPIISRTPYATEDGLTETNGRSAPGNIKRPVV